MNTFGRNIKLSFFGETSSPFFGLSIDGIKPGVAININKINESLNRYEDSNITWKFSSGIIGGFTTGSPITILIENSDPNIKFKNGIIVPSTSDLVIKEKYKGFNDFIDEGHFSLKSINLFIILGEICKQILKDECIIVITRIKSIKDIQDKKLKFAEINVGNLISLHSSDFPVLDDRAKQAMKSIIKKAREIKDTLSKELNSVMVLNLHKSMVQKLSMKLYIKTIKSYIYLIIKEELMLVLPMVIQLYSQHQLDLLLKCLEYFTQSIHSANKTSKYQI